MTDYSKMSDVDIAVQVGKHISKDGQALVGVNGKACIHEYHPPVGGFGEMCLGWVEFDPCNSWAGAGPIAERNFISLIPVNIGGGENRWRAANYDGNTNICADNNPCRAICIAFLMMKDAEKEQGNG